MKLKHIHNSLKDGCRIHAFLSGGGLRVVRIEKDGMLKGYGEHPHIEDALKHADEDYAAGGRSYKDTYGENGIYTQYLTGSQSTNSDLDAWVRRGQTFDIWQEGENVVFQLKGWEHLEEPRKFNQMVLKDGKSRQFERRGIKYEISLSSFPNGSPCTSTRIIGGRKLENGADPWMWEIVKTGRGKDFQSACEEAFKAEAMEKKK